MKILFLTNKVPYPPKDGGSIASLAMIEAFANSGHSVSVLAMNTKKHHIIPFEIPGQLTAKIIFHLVEVPAKVTMGKAVYNLLFSKLPYNAERFINNNYRKRLILLLKSRQFDIIQLEGLYLCPYIPTIRKYSQALVAYRSHNIEHEIWQRSIQQAKGLKRSYLKILISRLQKFEYKTINTYDVLIPITRRDQQKLNSMGNIRPALTIPAGFNANMPLPGKCPASNDLFFIGALDWGPNQEALLWFLDHCWEKIQKVCPKTTLTIAGRNAPGRIQKTFNRKNIFYSGEVGSAYQFMQEHGIMIAPLLSGSGMRVKIIEGMYMKKPIITTSIGCEGIDARDQKEIIIANSPEEFANGTIQLINDPGLREKLSDNSFKFVNKYYSNTELIKGLTAFYKKYI